jgi:hypothetical protein
LAQSVLFVVFYASRVFRTQLCHKVETAPLTDPSALSHDRVNIALYKKGLVYPGHDLFNVQGFEILIQSH